MIDMQHYIKDTLKDLENMNVPVSFVARDETELPLVVFNFSEVPALYCDDEEFVTSYKISVNIYSKGNYLSIKNLIHKKMLEAGFLKDEYPVAIYLEDIGVYNQPMFFSYVEDNCEINIEQQNDVVLNKL